MTTAQVETVPLDSASVMSLIESRFSCRAFLADKPIARQQVDEILRVASCAASSRPW